MADMTGNGVIVMRLDNSHHQFHEHTDILGARLEARRLAEKIGGRFVIYVPLELIQPAPTTVTTPITSWRGDDDDLPF